MGHLFSLRSLSKVYGTSANHAVGSPPVSLFSWTSTLTKRPSTASSLTERPSAGGTSFSSSTASSWTFGDKPQGTPSLLPGESLLREGAVLHQESISDRLSVLDKVSLDVARGDIVGIIGRSGAGKSTLLRCLNLLEKPTSGQIFFEGQDITTLSPGSLQQVRQRMGMIFQGFSLLSRSTVWENTLLPLRYGLGAQGLSPEAKAHVSDLLERVGLTAYHDAYPARLSGGQKQRVAIARALSTSPSVLLCDEATSALDPETTHGILRLLRYLNKDLGLTVVFVTHDMGVIRDLCTSVVVIDAGHVVEQGQVESVFSNPQHEVTRGFLQRFWRDTLPESLRDRLVLTPPTGSRWEKVVQLVFVGPHAEQPILASCMQAFQVPLNILGGYLDHIGHTSFGRLFVSFLPPKDPDTLSRMMKTFEEQGIGVTSLGFLTPHGAVH